MLQGDLATREGVEDVIAWIRDLGDLDILINTPGGVHISAFLQAQHHRQQAVRRKIRADQGRRRDCAGGVFGGLTMPATRFCIMLYMLLIYEND